MELSREEFSAVVTAHGRRMYRAARSVLDSDADKLRNREAIRPWLVKIAVNCAYAQRRKHGGVVYLEDLSEEPTAPEAPRYDGLWEAVCALPPDRRAAVVLFYYEDMSVEQIAKCLGVPKGTVKSRLSRARKQLKEMLCDEEGSYGTI